MSKENDLKGLRGWLIVVGIGVVFSPVRLIATYYPIFSEIFTAGVWEILTTPGTEAYHPLWGPLLIGEIIFNSLMVLFSVYLIYLFFTKHHLFPKIYIGIVTISLVLIPTDAWLSTFVLPDEPMFDLETTKEFMRTVIGAVIWIPYLLTSKRVKATFIKKPTDKQTQPSPENFG